MQFLGFQDASNPAGRIARLDTNGRFDENAAPKIDFTKSGVDWNSIKTDDQFVLEYKVTDAANKPLAFTDDSHHNLDTTSTDPLDIADKANG